MTRLRATTCLGENTVSILSDVVAGLRRDGVEIEFDDRAEPGERVELYESGQADLVWACGLLTIERIAATAEQEIVAAPVFAGESAPVYRSVVVVRSDDPARGWSDTLGRRLAVNEHVSWSGYHGFGRWLVAAGESLDSYPTEVLTGSHRNSALAVAEGVADVASIDHTVWDYLVQTEPAVGRLRVLATTTDWPAPPFSVRRGDPNGLGDALVQLRPSGLDRIAAASAADYNAMRSL